MRRTTSGVLRLTGLAAVVALSACTDAAPPQSPPTPQLGAREGRNRTVPAAVAARLNVGVAEASRKHLRRTINLLGRVAFDEDRVAIAGPRLSGRIVQLGPRPGEAVTEGTVLADLESVELARAGAEYLGRKARARAASLNAARERELASRRISSEREREAAVAEEQTQVAELTASEQLLLALGLSRNELPDGGPDRPLARFRVRAPISGIITDRPVVLGQNVDGSQTIARIADLSTVWVNLDVFERDLAWVRPGLEAELSADASPGSTRTAHVRYVAPQVDEATRTARVQLDVPNPDARLRPGQFVTARLASDTGTADRLTVPRAAVQTLDGRRIVFLKSTDGAFVVREVALGLEGTDDIEVLDGLAPGDQVAVDNAFLLKSEVLR